MPLYSYPYYALTLDWIHGLESNFSLLPHVRLDSLKFQELNSYSRLDRTLTTVVHLHNLAFTLPIFMPL